MIRSSRDGLVLLLFLALFTCTGTAACRAETDPPPAPDPASAPPPEEVKNAILVYAQYFYREGRHTFKVEGRAPYPNGISLGLGVFLRRRPSECVSQATIQGGQFATELTSTQRVLPGYYEVRATFDPVLQYNMAAAQVSQEPRKAGGFYLRIGSDEEIVETRKKLLEFYRAQIAKFKSAYYDHIRAIYVKIVKDKMFSRDRAKDAWDREIKSVISQVEKDVAAYRNEYADCIIPIFPQLHSYIDLGFLKLFAVTNDLELALVSDLAEASAASGKNLTREDILRMADQMMQDQFEMVETQLLLEEEEQLRDLLLNQMKELSWLHTVSLQAFFGLVESQNPLTPELQDGWKSNVAAWSGSLESLREGLGAYEKSKLMEKNATIIADMKTVPGLLSDLWALCGKVILEGRTGLDEQIRRLAESIDVKLRKMILVFDFGDEIEELRRGGYTVTGRGSAASQEHTLKLIAERFKELESDKPEVRLKAIKILVAFKAEADKEIQAAYEGGAPRIKDACTLVLGLCGDSRVFDVLAPRLESEKDVPTRAAVADAMGVIGKKEGLPILSKAMKKDKEPLVRAAAAASIGNLHLREGVPLLIEGMSDEDVTVRERAFLALGSIVSVPPDIQFSAEAPSDARAVQIEQIRQWWAANKGGP
ncbi:MAG: HEAT repeat domain-containing protein [Planctomycetes bacterium]|nr:HEAT repeat domain-containing protein [Planctomycetota bacterium]